MRVVSLFLQVVLLGLLGFCHVHASSGPRSALKLELKSRELLQDIVTWDEYSIMVRGERVMFLSGEFHPFRLPSPGLWLDVFQKIKAVGFSGVSFYVDWALLEGSRGQIRAEGVFGLEQFFEAATQAGIYLLARPGPYINSEVSGGGYPGWTARIKAPLRSNATEWQDATREYIQTVGSIISRAQITNGGPVILFQPENEYTVCADELANVIFDSLGVLSRCLDHQYMADVEAMWREAGIVLPFLSNDAIPLGNFVPGSGVGAVDIYGYDNYPLGLGTCSDPTNWKSKSGVFPTAITNYTIHMAMSPSSPYSITEFQGGGSEGWGGAGMDSCAVMVNHEFERVIYKVAYGLRATILNLYMTYGGTNWGNLGHPSGYTSYDYGAVVAEDRQVNREKYSELKLQANFLQVSPRYLTSIPSEGTYGVLTNTTELAATELATTEPKGGFYIVRHSDWTSEDTTQYKLRVNLNGRNVTIPQLGGSLSLGGHDSKIHSVGYQLGNLVLDYTTAEIFTWKKSSSKTVLVLYGGLGETHEFAVLQSLGLPTRVEGSGIQSAQHASSTIIQWSVESSRRVVHFGKTLEVHLLWRNDAYNYWVLDLPEAAPINNFVSASRINNSDASVIVKAGYLLRNASISQNSLYLWGDLNQTTSVEVIAAPLTCGARLYFNGQRIAKTHYVDGRLTATIAHRRPELALPDFSTLEWKYLDSLPEIQRNYDDSLWTILNLASTNSTRPLTTPTSLYASDYGFHSGSLIYRGHFLAHGNESSLFLTTAGGNAFGNSVWLNSTYLGSWVGDPNVPSYNQTFALPSGLKRDAVYVITVLIDHMGLTESTSVGVEGTKDPRGILDYSLSGHASKDSISWRMTGNFGGENYLDLSRGPLNEGAMFVERQGYHLPGAPLDDTQVRSPINDGISGIGVGFFATTFALDIPSGYDVPLSLVFTNASEALNGNQAAAYRVQLFVNGWQMGEYVNNLGPQVSYPVPEGILNHSGENYLALTLWSLETGGAKLGGLALNVGAVLQSAYNKPMMVEAETYRDRSAY